MDTSRLEIIRQCNPAQNPDKTRYTWDERGMGLLFAEAYRDALRYCPNAKHGMRMRTDDGSPMQAHYCVPSR